MGKEKNKGSKLTLLTIGIIVAVILIIGLIIYGLLIGQKSDKNKTVIDTNTGKIVDPELIEIYQMGEYERIRYYFNKYITYLEDGDYDDAYSLLDKDFKAQYFKTIEDFTKYVQSKYLSIISVSYDGVIRLGEYYVLTINFLDIFNSTDAMPVIWKTQKFIIYENDYNDFVMSFQAE